MGNSHFKFKDSLASLSEFNVDAARQLLDKYLALDMDFGIGAEDLQRLFRECEMGLDGQVVDEVMNSFPNAAQTKILNALDFIEGFTMLCRGSLEEKTSLMFDIFDFQKRAEISFDELTIMLMCAAQGLDHLSGTSSKAKEVDDEKIAEMIRSDFGFKKGEEREIPKEHYLAWAAEHFPKAPENVSQVLSFLRGSHVAPSHENNFVENTFDQGVSESKMEMKSDKDEKNPAQGSSTLKDDLPGEIIPNSTNSETQQANIADASQEEVDSNETTAEDDVKVSQSVAENPVETNIIIENPSTQQGEEEDMINEDDTPEEDVEEKKDQANDATRPEEKQDKEDELKLEENATGAAADESTVVSAESHANPELDLKVKKDTPDADIEEAEEQETTIAQQSTTTEKAEEEEGTIVRQSTTAEKAEEGKVSDVAFIEETSTQNQQKQSSEGEDDAKETLLEKSEEIVSEEQKASASGGETAKEGAIDETEQNKAQLEEPTAANDHEITGEMRKGDAKDTSTTELPLEDLKDTDVDHYETADEGGDDGQKKEELMQE